MTTNLWNAVLRLRDMHGDPAIAANLHVCLVFPYVPLPTTKAYWHEAFGNDPTPHSERVEMYALFIKRVCERGKRDDAQNTIYYCSGNIERIQKRGRTVNCRGRGWMAIAIFYFVVEHTQRGSHFEQNC